jgi:uncharacterized membrane protein
MLTLTTSIEIEAPVEKVFDFAHRVENLPEIWPAFEEVTNLQRLPDGTQSYDWTYKMAGVRLKGHSETAVVEECRRTVSRSAGGINAVITWTFEPLSANATRVTSQTDYTVPIPVIGKLAESLVHRMNEREAELTLVNLKALMEA